MMDLAESCASIAPNTAAKPVWIHTVKSTSGKRINCCLSWRGSCRNRLFSSYSDSYSYSFRQKFHSIYTFQLSINVFTGNTCVLVIWKGRSISDVYLLINVYDGKCLLNSQEMGTQWTTPLLDFAHEKVYFNLHSIAAISLIRQPEK